MIQNKLEYKHAYFYTITIQTYYDLMGNSPLGSHFCNRNISFWWLTSKQNKSSQAMFHVIIYDSCQFEAVFQNILPQNFWQCILKPVKFLNTCFSRAKGHYSTRS